MIAQLTGQQCEQTLQTLNQQMLQKRLQSASPDLAAAVEEEIAALVGCASLLAAAAEALRGRLG
jgi:hypothetical protein